MGRTSRPRPSSKVSFSPKRSVPRLPLLRSPSHFHPHLLAAEPNQFGDAPIEYKKHAEAHAEKVLDTVSAAAKSTGVICETLHVEHAQVYQAIIDAASARKCDLIVMASHGRRGVSAVVLGSETVKVLTHSKIPVLVYR